MYDGVSELYFAQARYYDPNVGRFISPDAMKDATSIPQTMNEYTYCLNNPLKFVDLNGLASEWPESVWEGSAAHRQIQDHYIAQFGSDKAKKEVYVPSDIPWTKSSTGFADLVITKPGVTEVYEIKKNNPLGIASGQNELSGYIKAMKKTE